MSEFKIGDPVVGKVVGVNISAKGKIINVLERTIAVSTKKFGPVLMKKCDAEVL